jgi:16S rRNA (adenine1518-N6/adenine1519-N6)-dimethyltransferase
MKGRNIKAKKSLGQNFLNNKKILQKMIDTSDIKKSDVVLEVGPGKGSLTELLLQTAKKVVAVEKDRRLIEGLNERFEDEIRAKKLVIIEDDALKFNPKKHKLKQGKYKIVANIPYYITGAFFEHFLSNKSQPTSITVMIQKEVAERIVTKDKKESILSISIKAYGEPKYSGTVSKKYFKPKPKVDSAIISVKNISRKNFKKVKEETFFKTVKKGFAHKRKRLAKNLNINEEILEKLGLDKNVRAEELSLSDWISLLN